MKPSDVVIVGGGISGLSLAWWLRREGVGVHVLEREQTVGGTMKTIASNGWLVECGPNSALETTPLFADLLSGLGIERERVYVNSASNKRYILKSGKLHILPTSPGAFLRSRLWSAGGKLRLLREPFIARGTGDESVAQFVERRLGREFLDYVIDPFVAGVFAGSPGQLSVQAAFPKLHALEQNYGGLIRGMIAGRKERFRRAEKAKDRAKMFSFRKGMQTLPSAIAQSLGSSIKVGCVVTGIKKNIARGWFDVQYIQQGVSCSVEADAVVLSVPAHQAGGFVRSFSQPLAEQLERILYPPVTEVFLGFKAGQIRTNVDGFGFLVPEKEKRQILGTIWSSSLFDGRAPEGHVGLTTFVGGTRQPDVARLPDDQLITIVSEELRSILGIDGGPSFTMVTRWEEAIPQYTLGYPKVLEAFDRFEKEHPGMFLCSNFRGGISVGDCITSSEKIAQRVKEHLRSLGNEADVHMSNEEAVYGTR